ncbi:MAG TPA: hypothetical protein VFS67_33735 [Polyangiaceae bacterium]|nr:hypothetical protein [Polyangiaceae bacterium]
MLRPYRAPSGKIRVLDDSTNQILDVSDPRCARFVNMSDAEIKLAGGYGQTPPVRIDFDTPIEAARGTTQSAIVHAPVAPSRPVVHGVQQLTEAERAVCRQLGISEADFQRQRRAEQTGVGGASRWRSGAVGGDE